MDQFSFRLVTPEKIFLEGDAQMIVAPGIEGDIGFLSNHINLITSIRPGFLQVKKEDNSEISVFVDGGFVKFSDNELLLVAEEVTSEDEINNEFINEKIDKYNEELESINDNEKSKILSKVDNLKLLLN